MSKEYHLIGCKYCKVSDWDVLTDGEEFIIRCRKCFHEAEIKKESIQTKPTRVIDMRFF